MSEGKVFLDANVLVYAHDVSAGRKHEVARAIVGELWISRSGVVSSQVLQEWFVSVTKKIPKPLDPKAARNVVEDLLSWEVISNDGASVLAAIDIQQRILFSFWDSLILQAALRAGATRLLSEDFTHGQKVDGLRIENPFLSRAIVRAKIESKRSQVRCRESVAAQQERPVSGRLRSGLPSGKANVKSGEKRGLRPGATRTRTTSSGGSGVRARPASRVR